MIRLHDYWRSSASYRVRIALNLKGLPYRQQSVHLSRDGGEHRQAGYARVNPQQLVPTLVDGEITLSQSLAIIDYLEERYPELVGNDDKLSMSARDKLAMALRDPLGFAVYAGVALAVRLRPASHGWSRGR